MDEKYEFDPRPVQIFHYLDPRAKICQNVRPLFLTKLTPLQYYSKLIASLKQALRVILEGRCHEKDVL